MSPLPSELVEPHLLEFLADVGLEVEYVRAEGNTLYRLDEQGHEIPVLDLVGGYGSVILGHNPPALVEHARELLARGTPIHAQFSRRPEANQVAHLLNHIIQRETGTDEPYYAIFGNSGAEAIEIALKHAELARGVKVAELVTEIDAHIKAVTDEVASGRARLDLGSGDQIQPLDPAAVPENITSLVGEVVRHNAVQLRRPPVFLAFDKSFHGKLGSSVQLTHNPDFRLPFQAMAAQARFVPLGDADALRKTIEGERVQLADLVVDAGVVRTVLRELPIIAALLVEPVQGEGGINLVTPEFAQVIQEECAAIGCPVVIDEIQSGMGRTGSFLASSAIGLLGDCYVLAKSLGGGLAKTSVTLFRQTSYRPEFELMHSSTYAKDSYSSSVALKSLELLESDDGAVYRLAAERGGRFVSALENLLVEFPDVVKDVRGRGLFIGFEFQDPGRRIAEVLGVELAPVLFGYLISGFLLENHNIRVAPTASATDTLRLEPSVLLTDEEIAWFVDALREVCILLSENSQQALRRLLRRA